LDIPHGTKPSATDRLSSMRPLLRLLPLSFLVASCSSEPAGPPPPPAEHSDFTTEGIYLPRHAYSVPPPGLTCAEAEPTPRTTFEPPASLLPILDGVWRLCGMKGPNGPIENPAAGVEITNDGKWFPLFENDEHHLVRTTGFKNEGQVEIFPFDYGGGNLQLNVFITGGQIPYHPAVSTSGNTLYLDYEFSATYVRTSETVYGYPAAPVGARLGKAGCDAREAGVSLGFPSEDALHTTLRGRWIACGNGIWSASSAGIEFDDTHWYLLRPDASGALVRSDDPNESSTLETWSYGAEPVQRFHVRLRAPDGGELPLHVAISEAPLKIQLEGGFERFVFSPLD
jgi:hypothetical protein